MPYLIGAIALVIALTAIILVFHSMYKAFRQDLADFNHCDNWDVTLTELEQIHTDSSHSVITVIRNFGFKFYNRETDLVLFYVRPVTVVSC